MIRAPVASRTDRAAPPRASPSSLVRITPSTPTPILERRRRGNRILADHRVDHQEQFVGLDRVPDGRCLSHQFFVDGQPARSVDDDQIVQ